MDGDEAMRRNGVSAFWRKKQYVIAGALVAIAAVGMTAVYSSQQAEEREQLEQEIAQQLEDESTQDLAASEQASESAEASSVVKPQQNNAELEDFYPEQAEVSEVVEEAEENVEGEISEPVEAAADTLHFVAEDGLIWPMEGNVILNYSMDATVYFATLDQYKYNPAIIIAGDVNNKVYSVAKGQITSIENDEVTGTTVTVDLGDGYEAVYGQLKEINFDEGDYLEAGHVIGYVSEPTKYYSVEGSNLYFELLKDGAPIDPIEYFE